MGYIKEDEQKELAIELAEENSLYAYNENEEGDVELNGYDFTDVIHTYGMDFQSGKYTVQEITNLSEDSDDFEEIGDETNYEAGDFNNVNTRNPYINFGKVPEGNLVFGTYSTEKGGFNSYVVETEDDFNPDNLIFLTCNMDETFSNDELIQGVIYKSRTELAEWMEEKALQSDEAHAKQYRENAAWLLEDEDETIGTILGELVYYIKDLDGVQHDTDDGYPDVLTDLELDIIDESGTNHKGSGAVLYNSTGDIIQDFN